jgi:hypothetical protein
MKGGLGVSFAGMGSRRVETDPGGGTVERAAAEVEAYLFTPWVVLEYPRIFM